MTFPPVIRADWANHFAWGYILASVAAGICIAIGHREFARFAAIGTSSAAGLIKEGVDALVNYRATGNWRKGPHGVEGYDFLATALGGVPVSLLLQG